MIDLFNTIKSIAGGAVYLKAINEFVPAPVDADTANMVFVEVGGNTVGFTSLTEEERAAVEALLEGDVIEYSQPIKAPDFIVATPDVESDPTLAMEEAVKEARKGKGKKKSMAKILLNLVEYVDDLEKRVKKLEKK